MSFSSPIYWLLFPLFSFFGIDTNVYVVLPYAPVLFIAVGFIILFIVLAFTIVTMSHKMRRLVISLDATQLALIKEQKISSFGALAAAAAHELGSPLSTISLAAKEVVSALEPSSPLMEDAQLIISQGDRCRDILAELSRSMKEDHTKQNQRQPISHVIELAAQSHKLPHINFFINKKVPDPEPYIYVTPDLIHGLGNILQNAFQFAKSQVDVSLTWDQETIEAIIHDDGQGYPPGMLPRLGEPQQSDRKDQTRGGDYQGMGLGLFLAKTLLSQRKAQILFYNDEGACCSIKWPASMRVVNSEKKD